MLFEYDALGREDSGGGGSGRRLVGLEGFRGRSEIGVLGDFIHGRVVVIICLFNGDSHFNYSTSSSHDTFVLCIYPPVSHLLLPLAKDTFFDSSFDRY